MACHSVKSVLSVVDCIRDPKCPLDRGDIYFLGVELEHLRRPRGEAGARDLERFRGLPPALRAATCWPVIRGEIINGGEDQLVWNQLELLPLMMEAFLHVGAVGAVETLVALGTAATANDEVEQDADVVQAFLAFRQRVQGPHPDGGADILSDVGDAILTHARAHPEEYVFEVLQSQEWTSGGAEYQTQLLRRPDAVFEVWTSLRRHPEPTGDRVYPPYWSDLLDRQWTAKTLDAATALFRAELAKAS